MGFGHPRDFLDDQPAAKRVRLQDDTSVPAAPVQRSSSGNSNVSNSVDPPNIIAGSTTVKSKEHKGQEQRNTTILPFATGNLVKDYILKDDELGRGQFGIVRTCIHRRSGALLACKTIMKDALQRKQQVDALKVEIAVLACLAGHPNIVEHVGVYEDLESVHVVMELCRGGDLFDLIKQAKRLREVDAAWLFRKIVGAVGFCHSRGLVHRDLKPENILVGMDGSVEPKLADFGLAVVLPNGHTLTGLAGSPSYMAPEVIWGEAYGASVDIWSLGVVLYFMLSGYLPFYGSTTMLTFASVCRGELDLTSAPWTSVSSGAKSLIRLLLVRDPSQRPSIDAILNHPWLLSFGPSIPATVKRKPFIIPSLPGHDLPEDPSTRLLQVTQLPPHLHTPPGESGKPNPTPHPPAQSSPRPPTSDAAGPSYAPQQAVLSALPPLPPAPLLSTAPSSVLGNGMPFLDVRSRVLRQNLCQTQPQKPADALTSATPHPHPNYHQGRSQELGPSRFASNISGVTYVSQTYFSPWHPTSLVAT